jgi:hypothetical protein
MRLKIRTLMIGVAVVAVLIGVGISVRRSIFLSREAASCSWFESFWRERADDSRKLAEDFSQLAKEYPKGSYVSELRGLAANLAKKSDQEVERADYYGRMKAKYEAASRRPWLSVKPDPPMPE